MKLFYINSAVVLVAIFFTTFLPTYNRVEHIKKHKQTLKEEIKILKAKNQLVSKKIQALKNDSYYLEFMVRKKFRMVREGEQLIE